MNRRESIKTLLFAFGSLAVPRAVTAAAEFLTPQESPETKDIQSVIDTYFKDFDIDLANIPAPRDLKRKLTKSESAQLQPFTNLSLRAKPLSPLALFNLELNTVAELKQSTNKINIEYIKQLRQKEETILRMRLAKAIQNIKRLPTDKEIMTGEHVGMFLETKELLTYIRVSIQLIDDYSKNAANYAQAKSTLEHYQNLIAKYENPGQPNGYTIVDTNRDKWPERNFEADWSKRIMLRAERIQMIEMIRDMILNQFQSETLKREVNKVLFLVNHESAGFDPNVHSSTTAVGLFQIVKSTWRKINKNLISLATNNETKLKKEDPANADKWLKIKNQLPSSLLAKMTNNDYSDLANRTNPELNALFGLSLYLAEGDVHWRFGQYWRWLVPGDRGDVFTYELLP